MSTLMSHGETKYCLLNALKQAKKKTSLHSFCWSNFNLSPKLKKKRLKSSVFNLSMNGRTFLSRILSYYM